MATTSTVGNRLLTSWLCPSTDQLKKSNRGFSFLNDEPLDMRMSSTGITAAEILNSWDEHAIELILRGFGDEKSRGDCRKEKNQPLRHLICPCQSCGKERGQDSPRH